MVSALKLLKSVGKFENVSSGAQLPLLKVSLLYAENARGKTTLASVLRSLATGKNELVVERRRIGSSSAPHVVIQLANGSNAIFQNGAWDQMFPGIAIFDDAFVADNVCSGVEVAPRHRQSLHELVIGSQGVALNNAVLALVDKNEQHLRELRRLAGALSEPVRYGVAIDAFCDLLPLDGIEAQLEQVEREVAALGSTAEIATSPDFKNLSLPVFDLSKISDLLSRGLEDLDAEALSMVDSHVRALGRGGERWIEEGLAFSEKIHSSAPDACPMCLQDITESSVFAHYRQFFGEEYKRLIDDIDGLQKSHRTEHDKILLADLERSVRVQIDAGNFWRRFTDIPPFSIDTSLLVTAWRLAIDAVESSIAEKRLLPTEPTKLSQNAISLVDNYTRLRAAALKLNEEFSSANAAIRLVRERTVGGSRANTAARLKQLRAIQSRHSTAIAPACDAYIAERAAKLASDARRETAREALDNYRSNVFRQYGDAINGYLHRFNASFRIGAVEGVNDRAGSSANYVLMIEGQPVQLAGPSGSPSFRNTLSAGDRNTLALAFFFAAIENDPNKASLTVVVDDPMTSLDENRTLHTVHEIEKISRDVDKVIVLSHSKRFLVSLWNKCRNHPRTALEVRRLNDGSTLAAWDVDADVLTDHDRRYGKVVDYLSTPNPADERQVAEALRYMLEAFARVAHPDTFTPSKMLGQFHTDCKNKIGTPGEVLSHQRANELREILDYANQFHHETNTGYLSVVINDAELLSFAKRTIRFIAAR